MMKLKLFQFHKGAIRTVPQGINVLYSEKFQFHKGAIRTISALSSAFTLPNFNSIKVRLERYSPRLQHAGIPEFQFHKGAIRTLHFNTNTLTFIKFQFHKGAIRTGV